MLKSVKDIKKNHSIRIMEKHIETLLFQKYGGYILLELNSHVNYHDQIQIHNNTLINSLNDPNIFVNDGFDLITPQDVQCEELTKIDYDTRIQTFCVTETRKFPCGMKLYPRSSIIKTPLRLANSVGVIDAGYRGNIMAMFDCYDTHTVVAGSRVVQLCASSLLPIYVSFVNHLSESNRGNNGFGSSGI